MQHSTAISGFVQCRRLACTALDRGWIHGTFADAVYDARGYRQNIDLPIVAPSMQVDGVGNRECDSNGLMARVASELLGERRKSDEAGESSDMAITDHCPIECRKIYFHHIERKRGGDVIELVSVVAKCRARAVEYCAA